MAKKEDPELTVAEAAALLGCSTSLVRYFDDHGRLSATRTPYNERIFKRSDVERLKRERDGK